MDVELLEVRAITDTMAHHAFTSIVMWKGSYYVAYRKAQGHGIVPGGVIEIQRASAKVKDDWRVSTTLVAEADRDFRDPKLVATSDTLYCITGAYIPRFPHTTLSERSSANLIQSYIAYTNDGQKWSPLYPTGRVGYWIWSVVALRNGWAAAAYHTGQVNETSSIHLLTGTSLLHLLPSAVIYDGASYRKDGKALRHAHASPCEPVLFVPRPGMLACALRTNRYLEVGITTGDLQQWRWHNTLQVIHPSAVLPTTHGILLAGRSIEELPRGTCSSTSLWELDAQFPLHRLDLPSAYDTGYAELCATAQPDTYLMSYYSQHETPQPYGSPLPGAAVYVARIRLWP